MVGSHAPILLLAAVLLLAHELSARHPVGVTSGVDVEVERGGVAENSAGLVGTDGNPGFRERAGTGWKRNLAAGDAGAYENRAIRTGSAGMNVRIGQRRAVRKP